MAGFYGSGAKRSVGFTELWELSFSLHIKIILIIIRYELGFRPRLIFSSKIFQVVFVHLVYNLALFLASCCLSFMLHVHFKIES